MLTDRRLSRPDGKTLRDDAIKLLFLESKDGKAILAYAGLGQTPGRTEPSEWMSRVLRGHNLGLEEYLEVLRSAAGSQLPKFLTNVISGHVIVCPAIVANRPRMFSIEVGSHPGQLILRNWVFTHNAQLPPPFSIAGSGAVLYHQDRAWCRELLRLVYAYNRGKISPAPVCEYLVRLNQQASRKVSTVSGDCIVAWRLRDGQKRQPHGGGAHAYDENGQRVRMKLDIPEIGWGGRDLGAFTSILVAEMEKSITAYRDGLTSGPFEALNPSLAVEEFNKLPEQPDERLK
jgi:hypothetical protein